MLLGSCLLVIQFERDERPLSHPRDQELMETVDNSGLMNVRANLQDHDISIGSLSKT